MTANENRINKGIAFDILHKLGYELSLIHI